MAEPSLSTPLVDVNTELCKSNNITLKVGPWGDSWRRSPFNIGDTTSQIIKKVVVYSEDVVNGLEIFYYVDWHQLESYKVGNTGGSSKEFPVAGDGEYINEIFGSFGDYYGELCITQIGFKTNLGKSEAFGNECGTGFNVPVVNGRIVGFFGQHNNHINEIGVSLALND